MEVSIRQSAPALPGANFASAFDAINQSIYTALANDPILGTFAKALPPPPKTSALFAGFVGQAGRAGLPFPTLPPPPAVPGARESLIVKSGGGTAKSPFT